MLYITPFKDIGQPYSFMLQPFSETLNFIKFGLILTFQNKHYIIASYLYHTLHPFIISTIFSNVNIKIFLYFNILIFLRFYVFIFLYRVASLTIYSVFLYGLITILFL